MDLSVGLPLVLLAVSQAVQQPAPEALPAEWIHGDTLIVRVHNFSVNAPSGWTWTRQKLLMERGAADAFIATSPSREEVLILLVSRLSIVRFDSTFVAGFRKGIQNALPQGWTIAQFRTEQGGDRPGVYRYTATITTTQGDTAFQFGHLIGGRTGYLFMMARPVDQRPATLVNVVASFRLLDPARNRLRTLALLALGRPRGTLITLGLVVLLIEAVMWRRKKSGASVIDTQQAPNLLARCLIYVGVVGALFLTSVELTGDGFDAAGAAGTLTGVLGMAFVVAYLSFGRASIRDWNKFAWLFCALAIVLPLFSRRP